MKIPNSPNQENSSLRKPTTCCRRLFMGILLAVFPSVCPVLHAATEAIVGNVRVQALSPTLVRIEQKGPQGFENRKTLTVVNRDWKGISLEAGKKNGKVLLKTAAYQVEIPEDAKDTDGILLRNPSGEVLHTVSKDDLKFGFLPSPGKMTEVWALPDVPRLVPPAWGATPAPPSRTENKETSGWDMANPAHDIYLFLPKAGDYAGFRQEFLKLTGPVPMPPLFAFGLWFSRYWPYSDEELLALSDGFRTRGFPFDLMVCDTDWRTGASTGYGVNTKLFPDMARYIAKAHEKNVRVMYNDHPEPQAPGALDPEELSYRENGLNSLLKIGADVWWYDKNWNKHLNAPEGLSLEFWGMVIYHDMTLKNRPDQRPLIMSNVEGIWNGTSLTPSNPAAHRYPIWWTGDTLAFWQELRAGIENGVTGGIDRMMPYINEDLGGHVLENTPEQFIRWFQYGIFSPLPRPHSYPKTVHTPWTYGEEAEKICREYTQLRYRLLPTIYTAVRRVYDDGTPLLQRCDLQWPQYPEAANSLQYLFGQDLLVAPQCYSGLDPIPTTLLKTPDGKPGIHAEYFDNAKLEGAPKFERTKDRIFYFFKDRPPGLPKDNISVRWTGTLGPVKETGEYEFGVLSRDTGKLYVDNTELISRTQVLKNRHDLGITTGRIKLEAGKSYPIKMEFSQKADGECNLFFGAAAKIDDKAHQIRSLWIPPGRWQDAWTGETLEGPKTITVTSDLEHTPLYIREGAMVVSTPLRMHTGVPLWENLVVDAFPPPEAGTSRQEVYEDDGLSNGYLKSGFSRTHLSMKTEQGKTTLRIDPAEGNFLPKGFKRNWTLRLHVPAGQSPSQFLVNGETVQAGKKAGNGISVTVLKPAGARVFPFMGQGASPGPQAGDVVEFFIPDYPADKPLTVGLALAKAAGAMLSGAEKRPNILFVLADDWGRHASCYRNPAQPGENDVLNTPHIDRVAREGTLFNNAFAEVSSCTPSRASIATGCHFWRTGKTAFHTTDPDWDGIPDPGVSLPGFGALLKDAGYSLTSTGKTLSPWTHRDTSLDLPGWYPATDIPIAENVGVGKYVRDHHVDRETALKALEDMVRGNIRTVLAKARESKAPFCHIFGPVGTHRAFVKGSGKDLWGLEPESFKGKLPGYLDRETGWEDLSDALGEVLALDLEIGWIVDELEKAGELENTVLVLAGDNGINIPRGKAQVYEHSVHAPLMIRWGAGQSKPGRTVDDFVSLIDLAPTFLEVAKLHPPKGMDGRSLLPLLQSDKSGQIDPSRDAVIVGRERHEPSVRADNSPYPVRAIRTKDFEYVRNFKPDRWPCGDPTDRSFPGDPIGRGGIISWIISHKNEQDVRPVFDLCYSKREAEELYDLQADPFMVKNIASDPAYSGTKRQLNERLMKVLKDTNDPRLDDTFDRPPYVAAADAPKSGKREKGNEE